MTGPVRPRAHRSEADPVLDNLLDEFAHKLQAGERVDPETFAQDHPERAHELRRVLPAIQVLAELASAEPGAAGSGKCCGLGGDLADGRLGDFRILREIGRGGMGVVYEAEQLSLGRRVALKVLPLGVALDARQIQRFTNEAQAAAHLHHTHIVPVFAVGHERGVHYYAMQLIEGRTVAALIAELRQQAGRPGTATRRPSIGQAAHFRTVAGWGMQAAEALAHAHGEGVVHRDIKPANLLLDAVDKLWITDFGLARFRDQAGVTLTGDFVGTLRYMSPEQALALRVLIDHRTDVYSLGVTLYELLTLEPAFPGRDGQELLRQIAFNEPRPARRINPALPAELETILGKATAKNPTERYATAQDLADDLRRFLEDKPIKARPPTLRQRVGKWARRHKSLVVTLAAAFVSLLVTVAAVATVAVWRIADARDEAKRRAAEVREKSHILERENYVHSVALAYREWLGNNVGGADGLLDRCPLPLRGWEWCYCKRLCHLELHTFGAPGPKILGLAFDGTYLATADGDGTVKLWDVDSGRVVFAIRPGVARNGNTPNHGNGLAFSPDHKRLALCSDDGSVKLLSAETGQGLGLRLHHPNVTCVAFSPQGDYLASGSLDGSVRLWDAAGGRPRGTLHGHTDWVLGVAFSPDGTQVATAGWDHTLMLWNARTGKAIRTFRGHERGLYSVAFSPDGQQLVTTSCDSTTRLWNTATGRELLTLRGHASFIRGVAFSPDGRRVATASEDNAIKLWDVRDGRELFTLRGHTNFVVFLSFSPDGTRLVSAGHDGTVKLWDVTGDHQPLTLGPLEEWVSSVAFTRDGKGILTASRRVTLWDATTGRSLTDFGRANNQASYLAVAPDGRRLTASGNGSNIGLWDVTTGKALGTVGPASNVTGVAFSPDGRRLAAGGYDGAIRIWDTARSRPA
jgi:WD40 repeat protein